jgi:hypothetical protein
MLAVWERPLYVPVLTAGLFLGAHCVARLEFEYFLKKRSRGPEMDL